MQIYPCHVIIFYEVPFVALQVSDSFSKEGVPLETIHYDARRGLS